MKKRYDSRFKSKVAVEAIKGERSIAEIASDFGVHPNLVGQWKKKALENLPQAFLNKTERNKRSIQGNYPEDELLKQIGHLSLNYSCVEFAVVTRKQNAAVLCTLLSSTSCKLATLQAWL